MPANIIDLAELFARVENDRDLLRDLLSLFKEEFPRHQEALRDAVESLDPARAAREAHTLKGMLSNLAAREAAEAAAVLESQARSGETANLRESLSNFQKLSDELLRQLDSCVAEVSG